MAASTGQAKMNDPWARPQLWKSGQFIASNSIASGIIRRKPIAMDANQRNALVLFISLNFNLLDLGRDMGPEKRDSRPVGFRAGHMTRTRLVRTWLVTRAYSVDAFALRARSRKGCHHYAAKACCQRAGDHWEPRPRMAQDRERNRH
jgi:hypothetical protein